MAIDIKDVLNIFYENECHFTYNAYDNKEFLILTLQDWNCQLYLTSPHPNGINFSLRYYVDANGQNVTTHPTYYTEDIDGVFPILNKIIVAQQKTDYLSRHKGDNEGFIKHISFVEAFKKVLAGEYFIPEFQCNVLKDENSDTCIKLMKEHSDVKYSLDLGQLSYQTQHKDKIQSIMGMLELNIYSESISNFDDAYFDYYTFFIPGYELNKYPLLQEQNKVKEQVKHVHHNFKSWIKDLIEFPNMDTKELQSRLQHAILEDEVPQKNSTTKNTKRKL